MAYKQEAGVLAQFRQRAITILQTEGFAGLVKRVIKRVRRKPLHHSYCVLALPLNHPIRPSLPRVDVEIKQVKATDDDDLEALVEFAPWADSKANLLGRLAEGQQCYVAKYKGRIVSSCWWALNEEFEFNDIYLNRKFKLAANEIFSHNVFTIPAFRGKGIFPYLKAQSARDVARTQGKTRALSFVQVTNRASLRSNAKIGATRVGRVGFVEVLGIRFHYLWGRGAFQETTKRFFVERM